MPKGYWIAHVTVLKPEQYALYAAATKTAFTKFEAVILARGGAFQSMEGEGHARNVVIEFPSFAQACACYNSPEYQEAKALREGAGLANITMVEGV